MFASGWLLSFLSVVIIGLISLVVFRKSNKTMRFYATLTTFLIIAAVFLHGIWFKLH